MQIEKTLKYPIGKFEEQAYANAPFTEALKDELLLEIKIVPSAVENSLLNLDASQLETPYRPGGWTVQQLVHHIADSHMNAYTRFKLALTENEPAIKPYNQDAWASLADSKLPVNLSVTLLHALHGKWIAIMDQMDQKDWEKTFYHPEQEKSFSLWEVLKMYSWHGRHHVAHIMELRHRNNWQP